MENRLQERYVKPIESCCSPETGLPETVTYEGREMPINQALRNPELFEKLHAMMEGNDEAQQALEDYRMAQSDIQSGRAALYLKDEARDLMEQFGVTERDARTDILDSITQRVEGLEQENEYVDPEIAELERQLEMEAQQVAAPGM